MASFNYRLRPFSKVLFFPTLLCTFLVLFKGASAAEHHKLVNFSANIELPAISIIIDDLGYTYSRDMRVANLPGPVTCAILPRTPYGVRIAEQAHHHHKEILLHQPMQATRPNENMGAGGLSLDMSFNEFKRIVNYNLNSLPYIVGINNHMGSLLSRHPGHMTWLMQVLSAYNDDLLVVDSYTTHASVIGQMASEYNIPNMRRDIFLDNVRTTEHITAQFNRLLATASKNGIALAIGHPYPQTIEVLEKLLPKLKEKGYHIVPISTLLNIQNTRFRSWRASLSP